MATIGTLYEKTHWAANLLAKIGNCDTMKLKGEESDAQVEI